MQAEVFGHERQPETSALGALAGSVASGEPLEDVALLVIGHAGPVVGDGDPQFGVDTFDLDSGRSTGILPGVLEQVFQRLGDPPLVERDDLRDVVVDAGRDVGAVGGDDRVEELPEAHGFEGELGDPGIDPADLE